MSDVMMTLSFSFFSKAFSRRLLARCCRRCTCSSLSKLIAL